MQTKNKKRRRKEGSGMGRREYRVGSMTMLLNVYDIFEICSPYINKKIEKNLKYFL